MIVNLSGQGSFRVIMVHEEWLDWRLEVAQFPFERLLLIFFLFQICLEYRILFDRRQRNIYHVGHSGRVAVAFSWLFLRWMALAPRLIDDPSYLPFQFS